jgi:NAD(P)H-hydrate epimerase
VIRPEFKAVLTREDMRKLDAATIAAGTPSLELMERAGKQVASYLGARRDQIVPGRRGTRPSLLVLAGNGNNGGDGFVIARLLADEAWDVTVALCAGTPRPDGDAEINLRRWRNAGGAMLSAQACQQKLAAGDTAWDLALDTLFGTGLDRPLTGNLVDLIRALNGSGIRVVSVDIPSGLCADTGHPLGAAVLADVTVTLGAAKPGLFVGAGPNHSGRIAIVDIGLLDFERAGIEPVGQVIDGDSSAYWIPHRHRMTHKGELGHVLVAGGQRGKTGAVLLAARGALRAGAGLVTMAVPRAVADPTDAALAEAMTLPLADTPSAEIAEQVCDELGGELERFTSLVIGPGMGTGRGAARLLDACLREFRGPIVVDADGLNVLAEERERLSERLESRRARGHGPVILTPHPGEMSRLLGTSSGEVQHDRLAACRTFTAKHAATLVLKGAATIVSDGERTGFNTSGNAGMASPGMGDVLSGITAAFAARLESPFVAASLAVYVHGLAADMLAARTRGPGFLASEVADALPSAVAALGTTID